MPPTFLCRNYATMLLASSWRYIVDMWTEYTASSLRFPSRTGSTLLVGRKINAYTYGTSKGKTFFRKWKAIPTLSSRCHVIQQRTKLLLAALIMTRLWDSGSKMADEYAEERIGRPVCTLCRTNLCSSKWHLKEKLAAVFHGPLLVVCQPGGFT